jgi:hypothetical protein
MSFEHESGSIPPQDKILRAQGVRDMLGCSLGMVYLMAENKEICHFHVGNRLFFRESKIQEWIEDQERKSVAGPIVEKPVKYGTMRKLQQAGK